MKQIIQHLSLPPNSLTITNGPHKGTSFQIKEMSITLGRHHENHIVIQDDPRCSRQHARITYSHEGFQIENVSGKNQVLINKKPIEKKFLQDGDKVLLGFTEFQLTIKGVAKEVAPQAPNTSPSNIYPIKTGISTHQNIHQAPNPINTQVSGQRYNSQKTNRPSPHWFTGKTRFYIIVGISILLIFLLLSGNSNKKKTGLQLRTSEQVQMELEKSAQKQELYKKQIQDQGKNSPQYRNAQTYYLKGFRDYRQGHYKRAMKEFSASLSLFPDHTLARKYYALAKRKFNELIQFNMIQGRRYRKKSNYRLCKAAFSNVLTMLGRPNDPIYKEAKTLFQECHKLSQGRY